MFIFTKHTLPELVQSFYPNARVMETTSANMEVYVKKLRDKYAGDWRCSVNEVRDNNGRIKCVHITMLGQNCDFETLLYAEDVTCEDLRRGCYGLVAQFAYAG